MNTSDRLPQFAGVSSRVSGGEVTGSSHQTGRDTNWWNRCAGGKGHQGITPSKCGYYQRAVRNGIKPVPKSKAAKPKASKQATNSQTSTASAGAFGRKHRDTASTGTIVGKIILSAIALAIVITLIGIALNFFGGLFGGQSDPSSPPLQNNQVVAPTQPSTTAPPITETSEESLIREVREFSPVALDGTNLGDFLERIAPNGEWDIRFGTEVTFAGETELGWLDIFVWSINSATNQIGLGIQLDGAGFGLDDFINLFSQ